MAKRARGKDLLRDLILNVSIRPARRGNLLLCARFFYRHPAVFCLSISNGGGFPFQVFGDGGNGDLCRCYVAFADVSDAHVWGVLLEEVEDV